MTEEQLKAKLEALIKNETFEVSVFFKERGEPTLDEQDVDPEGDRENCVWEDGYLTGLRKAMEIFSHVKQ